MSQFRIHTLKYFLPDFFGSDEVAADAHSPDSLYLWFLGTEPEHEGAKSAWTSLGFEYISMA
jgi:hypothetical protein